MSSSERFGFEWNKYRGIYPNYYDQYRDQFLNWVTPLESEYFAGKSILDAGCGMGRNSYWPLSWGAQELIAFDKDPRSVKAAKENLKKFTNAQVVESDIYDLPWSDKFDFAFSIGVIHHLKYPKKALEQIKRTLKPGGEILIWVYSKEGFETILKILNPIRKYITSRMPLGLLHALTYIPSVPFYLYLHLFPQSREYFKQLRSFSFSHMHSILFDQLLPDVAAYYSEAEARDLLSMFREVSIRKPKNLNGWIVRGIK